MKRRRAARGPMVDVVIGSTRWHKAPQAARLVRRIIAAAAPAHMRNAELSVILTNDRAIGALNRQWRGRDKPTNVLSFPMPKPVVKPTSKSGPGGAYHLGDIVIAYETTAREARDEGKPFDHHLAHLALHGFLHLLGYDHESHRQAETMERRERLILARLGVPDPYAERERTSRRSGRRFAGIGERSDAVLRTAMGERSDAVVRTAMGERSDAVVRTAMDMRRKVVA